MEPFRLMVRGATCRSRPRPAILAALALWLSACAEPTRPDVILVILDTVRADHLSGYGYSRPTTPNLDRMALEGQRYDQAWAQAPWTLPAVASILTGQPPHVHGAGRGPDGIRPVHGDTLTLAQRLSGAGYRTAAFINVVWCSPELSSLDRGFEVYDFRSSDASNRGHRSAGETTKAALDWVRGLGRDSQFLVVHYFDAHLTYDPPEPYDSMFEPDEGPRLPVGFGSASDVFAIRDGSIRLDPRERRSLLARYDGEIRYVDEQFGELRAGLEALGRWEDSLVIVVGDHGEEFWDHGGFEHGHSHFGEVLRVPLIVRRPGGPAGEVHAERVRQVDVAPTVLEFAGIPSSLPGKPLGKSGSEYSVAEGSLWAGDLVSLRSDRGSLILDRGSGRKIFFDAGDVFELKPLPAPAELVELLESLPQTRSSEARPLTDEQLERLRALGYVR